MQNPYLPYPVRIEEVITETEDKNLKTFKFVFLNPEDQEKFTYIPGQFAELSVAGKGEIPIGIAAILVVLWSKLFRIGWGRLEV